MYLVFSVFSMFFRTKDYWNQTFSLFSLFLKTENCFKKQEPNSPNTYHFVFGFCLGALVWWRVGIIIKFIQIHTFDDMIAANFHDQME